MRKKFLDVFHNERRVDLVFFFRAIPSKIIHKQIQIQQIMNIKYFHVESFFAANLNKEEILIINNKNYYKK